jgi:hypothetical protein
MSDYEDEPAVAVGEAARHRHLDDDLRSLVGDGLAYVQAEAELQKARAIYAVGRIKWIAFLGAFAVVFAFFSLVALTVGLVVGLAPLIGAIWATLAVFAALLGIGAICAAVAVGQWKRMVTALSNPEGER